MIDDMNHQSCEAIDEVLPGVGLFGDAPGEKIAIDFGKCHGSCPRRQPLDS
jgi:hypothetical protein